MNDSIVVYHSELDRQRDLFFMDHPELILWGFGLLGLIFLGVFIHAMIRHNRFRNKFPRW